jgi:hypothetical protein
MSGGAVLIFRRAVDRLQHSNAKLINGRKRSRRWQINEARALNVGEQTQWLIARRQGFCRVGCATCQAEPASD